MPSESEDLFADIDVSSFTVERPEQLGTKPKEWLRDDDNHRWLYKRLSDEPGRRHRGEDWAEKIVSEIAVLLDIPCARTELAHRGGTRGIISLDVAEDHDLVHGNELLAGHVPAYPRSEFRNIAAYRVDTVTGVLDRVEPLLRSGRPAVVDFAGYLVLDALVANTDRHHQNWAVLVKRRGLRRPVLAPTFDHASSLACGLTDDERLQRLKTKDRGYSVAAFARRARSPFDDARTLADAVRRVGEIVPSAMVPWRDQLQSVPIEDLIVVISRLPSDRMSAAAKDFAVALLRENHAHMIELLEAVP